jgi:hypothetical protein
MKFQEFAIPAALNGEQLKAELGCDEVYIREDKLVIGGEVTEAAAKAAIAAHVPAPIVPPTAAEKLYAATGLTVAEYKALGL